MKSELKDSQLAVERAGRATYYLLALSVILLLAAAVMFMIIFKRESQLQDGIREDAMWAFHQFDREARELSHLVVLARAAHAIGGPGALRSPDPAEVALKYDILYSRLAHLGEADLNTSLTRTPLIRELTSTAEAIIFDVEPVFNALAVRGTLDMAALTAITEKLQRLEEVTGTLLTRANAALATDRAEARNDIFSIQTYAFGLIIALGVCTIFLILNLMRQMGLIHRSRLRLSQAAQEMTAAYQQAEAGNRAKSVFMATIGHEIRTPLNAILGMAELLSQSRLPEKDRDKARTITRSGQTLLEMLNEILDFAKFEQGLAPPEAVAFRICDVVDATVDLMQGRAIERNNRLSVDLGNAGSTTYVGDPKRVGQILLNLVSNAIKFTVNGEVGVRVCEETRDAACWLSVAVTDTGIGISKTARAQLFTPFNQLDASISRHYGGTGLGLAICKQLLESLEGTIDVESTPGRGSVFRFAFPVCIASGEELSPPVDVDDGAPESDLPTLSVLLVEDNPVNRQIAEAFLARLNQRVRSATSGLQALDEMRRGDFDLVLMDVQMPEMDGISATRAIRLLGSAAAEVPIVAMTANASDEDRAACLDAGMNAVETKPMTMKGLSAIIRRFAPPSPSTMTTADREAI